MVKKHEKTHEATKIILAERQELKLDIEKTLAQCKQEIGRFDDKIMKTYEQLSFIEQERFPQVETTLKNTVFSLDLQRDALNRSKDNEVKLE